MKNPIKVAMLALLAVSAFAQNPLPAPANGSGGAVTSVPYTSITSLPTLTVPCNITGGTANATACTAALLNTGLGVQVTTAPLTQTYTVGTGGVTINRLVKLDVDGTVIAVTGSGDGILGVAQSTQSAAAPVVVALIGPATCVAEGSITAGNYVIAATTAPSMCKDSGQSVLTSISSSTRIAGKAAASVSDGATFTVELRSPMGFGAQPNVANATGVTPVANGGTGLTAGTSGGVLCYTATGTLASSGLLAANAILIGGGAGVCPSSTTTGANVLTFLGSPTTANIATLLGATPVYGGNNCGTANYIPYMSSAGVITCGANMQSNGGFGIKAYQNVATEFYWYAPNSSTTALSVIMATGTGSTSNPQYLSFAFLTAATGVRFMNTTASTGVTRGWFQEGAGQTTSEVFGVYANDGTTKRIDLTNNIFTVTSTLNVAGSSFTFNGHTCTIVSTVVTCP